MRGLSPFPFWRRLTSSRRWLLREAWVYLHLARWAIRLIPFRRLSWYFQRPAAHVEVSGEARTRLIQDVRWAIWTNTRHQLEQIVCFPRAVAAQAMLRRRGVSTTLYYGARTDPEKGLEAHVWVQDGERGIVGHRRAAEHKILARFSTPPLTLDAARDETPSGASTKIG